MDPTRPALSVLCAAFLLTGCSGGGYQDPTIDSSCASTVDPGDIHATPEALQALHRLNCYRNAMGLPLVRLDAGLSAAARAHAEYIDETGAFGHVEALPAAASFTGASPAARAAAAGYDLDEDRHRITEVLAFQSPEVDAGLAVDSWMDTVYHREPLATPAIEVVGFGTSGIYSVMELVSPWEASDGTGAAWVGLYPAPDQERVPTSFDSDSEWPDPAPQAGLVGYPASATVVADSWHSDHNPHALVLDPAQSLITGPSGPVASTVLAPEGDAYLLRSAALLPNEPLEPDTEYEAQLVGTLGGVSFRRFWSFRTAAE